MPFASDLPSAGLPPASPVLLPTWALILYGNQVMLKHPVERQGAAFGLGAASHLTTDDIRALIEVLGERGVTLTEEGTLAVSPVSLTWYLPRGHRPLFYAAKYEETRSIAELSGVSVPHPALVFHAQAGQLRVYALRGDARPCASTALYHAPYWNMFASGAVCRGSVKYPAALTPQHQRDWEDAFFNSLFTGPSRTDRYINWSASYEELQRHLITAGHFGDELLIPASKTLREVC